MTLSLHITADIERRLRERAAAAGQDPATYAADVLARDVTRPSIEELLEPVQQDFARGGMSAEEIMELGRRELAALRAKRREQRP